MLNTHLLLTYYKVIKKNKRLDQKAKLAVYGIGDLVCTFLC